MSNPFCKEMLVSNLGIKSKSKKEVYDLISQEGEIYLPPIKDAHADYISQVITGVKKFIRCKEVKVCTIPHLKGLRTEDILKKAKEWFRVDQFLPDYEYDKLPNRVFLCNLVNSCAEDQFKEYVSQCVENRTKYVVMKKKMTIKALPEFIDIFERSKNISVQKGRSHFLIKRHGRMKWGPDEPTKEELLKREKKKAEQLNNMVKTFEQKMKQREEMESELEEKNKILSQLYQSKIIDKDGNPL